jgi:hypothetical protein
VENEEEEEERRAAILRYIEDGTPPGGRDIGREDQLTTAGTAECIQMLMSVVDSNIASDAGDDRKARAIAASQMGRLATMPPEVANATILAMASFICDMLLDMWKTWDKVYAALVEEGVPLWPGQKMPAPEEMDMVKQLFESITRPE